MCKEGNCNCKALKRVASKLAGQYVYLVQETNKWVISNEYLEKNIEAGLKLSEAVKEILKKDDN